MTSSVWRKRAEELYSPPPPRRLYVRGHTAACEVLAGRRMITMNGKQHFSMHPALHEPKYPGGLHAGSEGMRRVCLPAPQVRSGRGGGGGGGRAGGEDGCGASEEGRNITLDMSVKLI